MDELDRLLAETMHEAAGRAPADDRLLSTVHRRSDRYRRRRTAAGASAVAAAIVVGVPAVAVVVGRSGESAPPATSTATVAPTASGRAVRLVEGYSAPVFPYTLPATEGMRAPVASVESGSLRAFFEATEQLRHADTTVTVSSREPVFTTVATETAVQVRGRAGTLRTVDVEPARQLTVTWQEAPGRWIQLATDDTYTAQQVVGLADSLTAASVAVLPPFELDLSPAGFVTDTITASRMTFRPSATAPDSERIEVVLRKRRELSGINEKVGGRRAVLSHDGGGALLAVDVTDWDATLEVTAGAGLELSDDELVRFAAGVHILNRSDPE
ncbi:hypothetical protein [Symbioplanes lichenis]|uniref:hypothetical protein n=1 Tax=Symbioplanes lichenis TaxID=1629072 RepID=UPI0027399477|nr:hypothetical protein [Actinoplanes lichenis]